MFESEFCAEGEGGCSGGFKDVGGTVGGFHELRGGMVAQMLLRFERKKSHVPDTEKPYCGYQQHSQLFFGFKF